MLNFDEVKIGDFITIPLQPQMAITSGCSNPNAVGIEVLDITQETIKFKMTEGWMQGIHWVLNKKDMVL